MTMNPRVYARLNEGGTDGVGVQAPAAVTDDHLRTALGNPSE